MMHKVISMKTVDINDEIVITILLLYLFLAAFIAFTIVGFRIKASPRQGLDQTSRVSQLIGPASAN